MVATNLKAEALKLMDQRSAMEAEMNAIVERLNQPGGPGISGNLINYDVIILFFFVLSLLEFKFHLLCCCCLAAEKLLRKMKESKSFLYRYVHVYINLCR